MKHPNDPPLSRCPEWCEKPAGHDWEDEWRDGVIRYHVRTWMINKYHSIRVEEVEQVTRDGDRRRQREVCLDVEAPTSWDLATAVEGLQALTLAVGLVNTSQTPEDVQEVH